MTPSCRAIVVDYEENGATVDQIAESFDVGVEAIETVLLQFSRKYREDTKPVEGKNIGAANDDVISDNDYKEICQMVKNLAFTTDDERLKAKLCLNLIDEKKGRKDWRSRALKSMKGLNTTNINVFVLNKAIQKSREERIGKVIDLVTVSQETAQ